MLTSTTRDASKSSTQSTPAAAKGSALRVQLKAATFAQGAALLQPEAQPAGVNVQKEEAAPDGTIYRVQLITLSREPTADERARWKNAGNTAITVEASGKLYKVFAGSFATKAEAAVLRDTLAKHAELEDCFVTALTTPDEVVAEAADDAAEASVNDKILAAAQAYRGTSTAGGPGGGNVSCAWAMNNVLKNAIGRTIGSNTNAVTSIAAALAGGEGTFVPRGQEQPGDLVVAPNGHHIGVYLGGGKVLSNSSSKSAYVWESGLDYDDWCGSGTSTIYRVNAP